MTIEELKEKARKAVETAATETNHAIAAQLWRKAHIAWADVWDAQNSTITWNESIEAWRQMEWTEEASHHTETYYESDEN